jgi:GMP reductase
MRIINSVKLDFDNVLLRPKRSDVGSRKDVDLKRMFTFLNSKKKWEGVPIVVANLDTTGTFAMAKVMKANRALCCLHKFYKDEDLVKFFWFDDYFGGIYTLGASDKEIDKCVKIFKTDINQHNKPNFLCMDVANGYTQYFKEQLHKLREKFRDTTIIAGNVATPEMVESLLLEGIADIIKVGIGPGSLCKTRKVSGVGYPQLSAIIECADAAHGLGGHIMADGGCKDPGDVVKAFAAGADFVMIGGMFCGTSECDGEWIYYDDSEIQNVPDLESSYDWEDFLVSERDVLTNPKEYLHNDNVQLGTYDVPNRRYLARRKVYKQLKKSLKCYGMSSKEAMINHYGSMPDYRTSEGLVKEIPYKGPAQDVMNEILGGLRSACTYVGARRLKELSKRATFIRVR